MGRSAWSKYSRKASRQDARAMMKYIKQLKKNGSFKTLSVVTLKAKAGLRTGTDERVDPYQSLPAHLHSQWLEAVAATQVWAKGKDIEEPALLVQALLQRGPLAGVFNLQTAVCGDCPVVILGDDWEQIAPVGNYLFDSTVVNLLDDWRLGFLQTISHKPHQLMRGAKSTLKRKLRALSFYSPVLTSDLKQLVCWATFKDLRMQLGDITVCWWVVKVLLLHKGSRMLIAPATPQTFCKAKGFTRCLPGVGVAQAGFFNAPMDKNNGVQ